MVVKCFVKWLGLLHALLGIVNHRIDLQIPLSSPSPKWLIIGFPTARSIIFVKFHDQAIQGFKTHQGICKNSHHILLFRTSCFNLTPANFMKFHTSPRLDGWLDWTNQTYIIWPCITKGETCCHFQHWPTCISNVISPNTWQQTHFGWMLGVAA